LFKARAVGRYLAASRHWLSVGLLICGALVLGTAGVGAAGPGTITEFNVPTFGSDPLGIAAGPGNTLWVADSNDFDVRKVERFSTDGVMTGAFNVPGGASVSCPQGCVDPAGILLGPDGNMWFTELTQSANAIGKLDPNGPQGPPATAVTSYPVPTVNVNPWAVTLGSDGNVWFTENVIGGRIGRITPGGTITEFSTHNAGAIPFGITSGPDGNLWFTEQTGGQGRVGLMTTAGTMLDEILVGGNIPDLSGITTGSDHNVWFAEQTAGSIGRIDGSTRAYLGAVPDAAAGPQSITTGRDGLLYFTEAGSSSIGRFDPRTPPASVTTHFRTPTRAAIDPNGPPTGITMGPDGNIWFTEGSGKEGGSSPSPIHNIGRLTLEAQTQPAVSLGATSLDFGAAGVGQSGGSSSLTVTNSGNGSLSMSTALIAGPDRGDFAKSGDTCSASSVNPGGTCTVAVTFSPRAAGPRNATLILTDSAADSPQRVPLSGMGTTTPTGPGPSPSPTVGPIVGPTPGGTTGYWLVASDGGIFNYGDAAFLGSTGAIHLNKPIVAMAPTPTGKGYWLVASDGGIFNYGDAPFLGSTGSIHLNSPIVGMAATPTGQGYWLVASDGGIFNYGDAPFLGSSGSIHLNKPIVAMTPTPTGQGYWLVASDGGIFNYGDAAFLGSSGSIHLNKPIVAFAARPSGRGYWLVASDGGIFNYGDAAFLGSSGAIHLNKPIVAMAPTPTGRGYWLVASDGGIFNYGDAAFLGSAGSIRLNNPIVGMAAPSTSP
jgi:streptogramin lyase